jgi:type I restriction enzyme M protein
VQNNNKPAVHVGKVCLVDASQIYTAQRAQNVMTEQNILDVHKLCTDYANVIEKAKVVTLDNLREKDYTLSVSVYIDKAAKETISPAEVRADFFDALKAAKDAETRLTELLAGGGYTND